MSASFVRQLISISLFWLCCLTSVAAFSETPSLAFKGVELGKATPKFILTRYPGANVWANNIRANTRNYAVPKCGSLRADSGPCLTDVESNELFRIGDTSLGEFLFLEFNGLIERVEAEFSTPSYPAVLAALEDKYGKSTSSDVTEVKNLLGATLVSRSAQWILPDGEIIINERSEDITIMRLTLTTKRYVSKLKENKRKGVKDAAKSL